MRNRVCYYQAVCTTSALCPFKSDDKCPNIALRNQLVLYENGGCDCVRSG